VSSFNEAAKAEIEELFSRVRQGRFVTTQQAVTPYESPIGPGQINPVGFIAQGALSQIDLFADDIRPPVVVAVLPTLPDDLYPVGSFAFLTTDQKLYRNTDGSTWSAAVDAVDLTGHIGIPIAAADPTLPDATDYPAGSYYWNSTSHALFKTVNGSSWIKAIEAVDIVANAITAGEIAAGTISSTEIAALSITGNNIAAEAVSADKILANSITAGQIAGGAITADKLAATLILVSLLETAASGRRVAISGGGIVLYDTDESILVNIPTNGDPVYVKGQVDADSLVSESTAEFRGVASLAGEAVMTLQNGVSDPTTPPSLVASVDSLALTSTPPNLGHGITYDSAGGAGGATPSFWIGADPSTSDYVAHEYNASTGALLRSILKTDTLETLTTTLGATSHVSDTAQATIGTSNSQVAAPLTIPSGLTNPRITKVSVYMTGYNASATVKNAVWSTGNTLLGESSGYTPTVEALGTGNSDQQDKALTSELAVTAGTTYRVGFLRTAGGSVGFQWDRDDGPGTTYLGDGLDGNLTGVSTDTTRKPNVYITYKYDVGSDLEGYTGPIIGVARQGSYVWVLESTGILYRYNQSGLTYVDQFDLSVKVTGTKANAGLFWDGTNLIITTATGTTGTDKTRFVKVTTAGAFSSNLDDTTLSVNGSTATFRGGVTVVDVLNGSVDEYWVPISGTVYAFLKSTGANVTNRNFGTSATALNGLTYDGTIFRGWAVASPTKVWKFSAWDWTSASAVYWIAYAWYDDAGTTHETAVSPRTSLTLRRHERVLVTTPAIVTGGADDPNKVRIYMKPNATDPGAGALKLQVTDALTARYLTDYNSSGAADGGGTAFPASTPAEIRSAPAAGSGGWSFKGSGVMNMGGTAFPGSPATNDQYYRTDLGMWFYWNGTRWLTVNLYECNGVVTPTAATAPLSATGTWQMIAPAAGVYDLWQDDFQCSFIVIGGTALSASHKWVITLIKQPAATTIATVNINSGALNVWRTSGQISIAALLGTSNFEYDIVATKTGTPGTLYYLPGLTYRMVG
jgi:hypothetical protein